MNIHPLCYIDNQLYVGVVVIVCATRNFHIVVCHPNVICIGAQIFRSGHDGELNSSLVAKRFVGPFSNRANLLDGRNTVVGNQNLSIASYSQLAVLYFCELQPALGSRELLTFVITV